MNSALAATVVRMTLWKQDSDRRRPAGGWLSTFDTRTRRCPTRDVHVNGNWLARTSGSSSRYAGRDGAGAAC